MRAAQIENNVVINYVEIDGCWGPFVDPKDSVLGATYDPETETFINPPPVEEPHDAT